jgi:hypothetical protein
MAANIDFILPSCYGIPESMWLVVSAMLDTILKRCWFLLGAFVVIKMLVSAFSDLGEDRFSLGIQFRILAQACLIAIFFTYYKTFLMTFDYFIDSLCFFEVDMFRYTVENTKEVTGEDSTIAKFFLKFFKKGMFFLTQTGPIRFMHYIKSIALLILSQLGPFAALFSLLPGPFRASFKSWSKGYLNVSCWTITLAIINTLASSFTNSSAGPAGCQALLSFVLFISSLFTPTWTAKLISGVNLGNLAAAAGTIPEKVSKSIPAMRVGNKRGK